MLSDNDFNKLYRYALSLCNNEDDAFDLVQAAFEKYLSSRVQVEKPLPYIRTIIRNRYFDEYRRNKLSVVMDIEYDDEELKSLEELQIDEQEVELVLSQLNDGEREILFLWAVEGFTIQEIANLSGEPKGTLLSRVHRLKKRLQEHSMFKSFVNRGEQ